MASVPLFCNICPKRPEFSDISHLLTHVGSKGHLSHYFKAQVRSRQEPAVRLQLDIYDRWYAQHQIEKLLSQRMVLKESKDIQIKPRMPRKITTASTASKNSSRTFVRGRITAEDPPTDVKAEEVIDPRLTQVQPPGIASSAPRLPSPICDSQAVEIASRHRAYVPRMRRHQTASPPLTVSSDVSLQVGTRSSREKLDINAESDSEYEEASSQKPAHMAYPDPCIHSSLAQTNPPSHSYPGISHTSPVILGKADLDEILPIFDEAGPTQSPVLKGVQWPGMDIFDSACPEAQRKRNQKKDIAIMAQIELNSTEVEPLERIYWPEGGLKKERLITGMVESSPIKELTPKPKRRRPVPDRPVLSSLSTNEPTIAKRPRARKPLTRSAPSNEGEMGDLSNRGAAMQGLQMFSELGETNSRLSIVDEADLEWRLNAGDFGLKRSRDFVIFDDEIEQQRKPSTHVPKCNSKAANYPFLPSLHHDSSIASAHGLPSYSLGLPFVTSQPCPSPYVGYGRSSSTPQEPSGRLSRPSRISNQVSTFDKENLHPSFEHQARLDDETVQPMPERSTQRYFSVSEAHPPQFFDFLPPQMEFGGLVDPTLFGSSLNPLNPSAQFQHSHLLQRQGNHKSPITASGASEPPRRKKFSS